MPVRSLHGFYGRVFLGMFIFPSTTMRYESNCLSGNGSETKLILGVWTFMMDKK